MTLFLLQPLILLQEFMSCFSEEGIDLPPPSKYATGIIYLDPIHKEESEQKFEDLVKEYNCKVSQI